MQIKIFVNNVLVHRGYDMDFALWAMKEWKKHNPDAEVKLIAATKKKT